MPKKFIEEVRAVLSVVDRCVFLASPVLVEALIIAEDRRFRFHAGVDVIALMRAGVKTVLGVRLEGASTIEAQLFRTVVGRREISVRRKLRELLGASIVSLLRSKVSIANAYLDKAYFGFDNPGIRSATEVLGYDINLLTRMQSCEMVSRLKRPLAGSINLECREAFLLRVRTSWVETRLEKWDKKRRRK